MLPVGAFAGKVALITGGSSGIGRATASELARLGAQVAIAARGEDRLRQVRDELRAKNFDVVTITCDLTDAGSVQALVDETKRQCGRIDILVNSVGWGSTARAEDVSVADWDKSIKTNLYAAFFISQVVGRAMIHDDIPGSILHVAASRGWNGSPTTVHVGCTKAAVISITKTLAVEWARFGIRVNALAPGAFETERQTRDIWGAEGRRNRIIQAVPAGRIAQPQEAAWAIAYLVSDFARYLTGEVLTLDGGWGLNHFSYFDLEPPM